jgi:hypothetical protein
MTGMKLMMRVRMRTRTREDRGGLSCLDSDPLWVVSW